MGTVEDHEGDVWEINVDKFHYERAFVIGESEIIYVTEDQGKTWKQISVPKDMENESSCCFEIHPFNKNFILLHCDIGHRNFQLGPNLKKIDDSLPFLQNVLHTHPIIAEKILYVSMLQLTS